MPYLIDSDIVIDHLAGVPDASQLIDRLSSEGVAISMVTYMEVWEGILRSPMATDAQQRFAELIEVVPLLPFSDAVARRTAQLREDLRRAGKNPRRRALDLIIAATALEYEFVLVTRNVDDYTDVPGLELLRSGHQAD